MYSLLLLLVSVQQVFSVNILYLNTIVSPSHHIWHYRLTQGLNERGHNVTLMEPMKSKAPASDLYHPIYYEGPPPDYDQSAIGAYSTWDSIHFFEEMKAEFCRYFFKSKELKHLLENKHLYKFDALIMDLTVAPCCLPMVHEFSNIPAIAVSPFMLPQDLSFAFGNNLQPAYIPHYFTITTDNMSFWERLDNFITTYMGIFIEHQNENAFNALIKDRFGPIPTLTNLMRRVSLLIANQSPLFDYPQPLPPNIIAAGGLQAKKPQKLPEQLQQLMDSAKHGVIVFSLGTNVRSDKLGKDKQQILLDAFKQLEETIIWKFESDLPNLPKNVHIQKWLPQNDVIAHKNTKLFIGHGGALSTQEAFYHGVPIIGIPFFFDQYINVQTFTRRKRGLMIDIRTMTTESVLGTIKEILNNPIYRKNMQLVSERFKDLPQQPLENAVKWVEYAIKHNGTAFLDMKSRDLTFWQMTCLDLVFTLLLGAVLVLLTTIFVLKLLLRLVKSVLFAEKSKRD